MKLSMENFHTVNSNGCILIENDIELLNAVLSIILAHMQQHKNNVRPFSRNPFLLQRKKKHLLQEENYLNSLKSTYTIQ